MPSYPGPGNFGPGGDQGRRNIQIGGNGLQRE